MAKPRRIQRRRTNGWRMPEGAVYVGRPTRWGNRHEWGAMLAVPDNGAIDPAAVAPRRARLLVVLEYIDGLIRAERIEGCQAFHDWLAPLRGHDLACWCPLDQPCHADVLLELANA